jgi:hypothetical protein
MTCREGCWRHDDDGYDRKWYERKIAQRAQIPVASLGDSPHTNTSGHMGLHQDVILLVYFGIKLTVLRGYHHLTSAGLVLYDH